MSKEQTEQQIVNALEEEFGEGKTPCRIIKVIRLALMLGKYNRSGVAANNTIDRIARPLGVKQTTIKKRNWDDDIFDCPVYTDHTGVSCDLYSGPEAT